MDYQQTLEELITGLINQRGSDIHLRAGSKPALRVEGDLIFLINNKELTEDDMINFFYLAIKNNFYRFLLYLLSRFVKKGCFKISSIVMRSFTLTLRHFEIKSDNSFMA